MKHRRILLDIETQRDLFLPAGSCFTPQAPAAARNICRLFDWAARSHVPVISTVLRVRRFERGPLAGVPHCVEGTDGERKLPGTVLPHRVNFGLRNCTDLPGKVLSHYQQVVFEKRVTDIFAHARLERLISELPPATFVICGAGVAKGIVQAAVGLRYRGFGVLLASDAVVDLGDKLTEMAYLRMQAKGVIFAPTGEIVVPRPRPRAKPFRRPAHAHN
jgi:nicotinamidase-related amidase